MDPRGVIVTENTGTCEIEKKKVSKVGKKGLHHIWIGFSLEQKVRFLSMSAAFVVILSILTNILVAAYGIRGFGSILESNSKSLQFWSAIEAEGREFASYVMDGNKESRDSYEAASRITEQSIRNLPFEYAKIGEKRYAKTWSVLNMYGAYIKERDDFLKLSKDDPAYLDKLYTIYRLQGYLKSYAGTLEQMTVEMGTEEYLNQRPFFMLVPVISILWGTVSLFMVRWLEQSVKRSIIRPVVELAKDSKRIGENDFSGPGIVAEGEDEIAHLVRAFGSMKASTQGYITTLNEKHEVEKQLDAVRLQMLKNQINPHFLFNTLNMIASTAQIEDAVTTEKMIEAMSSLFRYNLKSTDSVMPLERELKIVKDYMYLQQMRFGKRIRYTADCHEDTLPVLVPAFALQPLVENAIIHGLSPKSEGGLIHIHTWMEGRRLWISVADTGAGMSKTRLEEIKRDLKSGEEKKTGVGVGNIYRRVHSMYADGQVVIESRQGCGTVVQLAFTAE